MTLNENNMGSKIRIPYRLKHVKSGLYLYGRDKKYRLDTHSTVYFSLPLSSELSRYYGPDDEFIVETPEGPQYCKRSEFIKDESNIDDISLKIKMTYTVECDRCPDLNFSFENDQTFSDETLHCLDFARMEDHGLKYSEKLFELPLHYLKHFSDSINYKLTKKINEILKR